MNVENDKVNAKKLNNQFLDSTLPKNLFICEYLLSIDLLVAGTSGNKYSAKN